MKNFYVFDSRAMDPEELRKMSEALDGEVVAVSKSNWGDVMGKRPVQYLSIGAGLPTLNEYINAERANKFKAASLKKKTEEKIRLFIRASKITPLKGPVKLHYTWTETHKRKDKDNIMFAQKFVQDALVTAGILSNDGWNDVTPGNHEFKVGLARGVAVIIEEDPRQV